MEAKQHRITLDFMMPSRCGTLSQQIQILATTGHCHDALAYRSKCQNILSTHAQRVEEQHAKIHKVLLQPGQPLSTPAMAAKLSLRSNLGLIQMWQIRLFVEAIWRCKLVFRLFHFISLPSEFKRSLSKPERLSCIYHAHPQQLYDDVSSMATAHKRFQMATSLPAIKLGMQEKCCVTTWLSGCRGRSFRSGTSWAH